MRRVVALPGSLANTVATVATVAALALAPAAAPVATSPVTTAPAATAARAPAGEVVCTVDDPRAVELSGLVATADGYVSETDSQFDPDTIRVIFLDPACAVTRTLGYPTAARDPEDLAVHPDGTIWVADTGDNNRNRSTVALWRLPAGGGAPVIHRLSYPDGPHDAEALLFDSDGTPIIVTKELNGVAGLYRAAAPLSANAATGVPLQRVGEFRPSVTGASNPLGTIGELVVTGAATSPDRRRVVLRTYAAAYEWDVPDGDVVAAVTRGTPRYTVLPDEPQGEAIAYTVDGRSFLTVSDESGPTGLRRYTPSTVGVPVPSGSPSPTAPAAAASTAGGPDWALVGGLGALGLGLLALATFGVIALRARRAG